MSDVESAWRMLRQFARTREAASLCELCSRPLAQAHAHLVEPASRRVICACDACALLFPASRTTIKRVPRMVRALPGFSITDAQWESLLIPIGMAFFYDSSEAKRVVALYPSPAGATESLLPLETWQDIVREHDLLARMEPDVEALVANRLTSARGSTIGGARGDEYFLLPIDECFHLVGLIRLH
jgi:hypothetical protein